MLNEDDDLVTFKKTFIIFLKIFLVIPLFQKIGEYKLARKNSQTLD
jgi:hypothetical protein